MSMDLTGITNQNEYYTNHYFSSIFEENAAETISKWRAEAKDHENVRTPWAMLRDVARQYYPIHDRFLRSKFDTQTLANIRTLADMFLNALSYPEAKPEWIEIDDMLKVPVYLELTKSNGAPALWVMLVASEDKEAAILDKYCFAAEDIPDEGLYSVPDGVLTSIPNEDMITKILFSQAEPPRFVILVGMNQIALIDRNKWNEKRYLQFELEDIFSRHEESTLQAMAVLLHKNSLCPEEGTALLDELDANSQKHAAGVSQDLKYALRESIEILGNEVLYDMRTRQGRDLEENPVDAGELTLECLRYMYRMLFLLFIEARPELGYAPIQNQTYKSGYSLDSLRDIADDIRDDVTEVGGGYFLYESLSKLYDLIYNGYPKSEEELLKYSQEDSLHDMFVIAPLKAHIFDPEYTKMIGTAKLRNSCMLRIIDLMSLTRETGRKNERRGRISYSNLGINQMGAVYEALLSYRGFIAEHTLYEVKRAGDSFNELDVGYFVTEEELDQYTEDERVRYEEDDPDGRYKKGQLRKYEKETFIYRLAGREREKSASYYTPEVLTKCLVKYALKELLQDKTADEILHLTICEPAMGSAAFLNEAINQLAEAYLDKKQKERGEMIPANDRLQELQKVKMYMADRNVYGIDLNPVAVELAEVSLWLNTIYEGGFVPWFGTQLINGNSLIGARRQVYRVEALQTTSKGLRWYENAPDRVPLGTKRMPRKQVYHFLLGDPGMCNYTDKVIKSLEPDKIKAMKKWKKKFTEPYSDDDIVTLLRLSAVIDDLWEAQVNLRKEVEAKTQDKLSVYGYEDDINDSHTTIRQKDQILSELYKSEHMRNAGPYARLKFAMDYWCALWFWPIDKANLLPNRSEFLFDMSMILEGTTDSVVVNGKEKWQMSLFPSEMQQLELEILETYGTDTVVDIPRLRKESPRLDLAYRIAEQNHFMHWELEFADLFAERGGFDLVLGNPPWRTIEWKLNDVISDFYPSVYIQNISDARMSEIQEMAFSITSQRQIVFEEYAGTAGQQSFLDAPQNYIDLIGIKPDLYKAFLPKTWSIVKSKGIVGLLHPEGVYDDAKGGEFRRHIYRRLRRHYQFINQKKLFDRGNTRPYSINLYSDERKPDFDAIFYLFDPHTIDEAYELESNSKTAYGIKDEKGNWNEAGDKSRIIHINQTSLSSFVGLLDEEDDWQKVRMPMLYSSEISKAIESVNKEKTTVLQADDKILYSEMLTEPKGGKSYVKLQTNFPDTWDTMIYAGPNISISNPFFKSARKVCTTQKAFDPIDLTLIKPGYLPRNKYTLITAIDNVKKDIPKDDQNNSMIEYYRIVSRKMIDKNTERSLMSTIIPPKALHMDSLYSILIHDLLKLVLVQSMFSSIIGDFLVKMSGKSTLRLDLLGHLPVSFDSFVNERVVRTLLLISIDSAYSELWEKCWNDLYCQDSWTIETERLDKCVFSRLSKKWDYEYSLKTDFARRQLLVENDVLNALSLGLTVDELKTIYRLYFPVLRQYEDDTWYDANGRIAFTNNRSLTGVGFERSEWENNIKGAPAGKKFYRTITDDTIPGGPVERTIEYVAPFDRCDREKDYEIAWKFFEEKYKDASQ